MKLKNLCLGLFASALFLTSCSSDDSIENEIPLGVYDNGVFILNEGNFGTPNASVSFVSNDLNTFQNNIFGLVNQPKILGDVAQSMSFAGDNAFIVINNSNEIEVVNRHTFESIATITAHLEQPRYSISLNGKLYVTNAISKAVTVYDANNFTYIASIPVNKTVERIIKANGKIYVMNGSFGSGNEVTVINPATNAITGTITVEEGINSIEEKNGSVYVLCGNANRSKLFKINTATDTAVSIESVTLKDARNMDIDGSLIYYTKGNGLYSMDLNAAGFTETPSFSVADNSFSTFYGFGVIDGKIYSGDANGFTQDGVVTVYSPTGSVLKTMTVAKGPNGFYPNN